MICISEPNKTVFNPFVATIHFKINTMTLSLIWAKQNHVSCRRPRQVKFAHHSCFFGNLHFFSEEFLFHSILNVEMTLMPAMRHPLFNHCKTMDFLFSLIFIHIFLIWGQSPPPPKKKKTYLSRLFHLGLLNEECKCGCQVCVNCPDTLQQPNKKVKDYTTYVWAV